jgi:hypothetical protein
MVEEQPPRGDRPGHPPRQALLLLVGVTVLLVLLTLMSTLGGG